MRTTTHIRIDKKTKALIDELKRRQEQIKVTKITYDAWIKDIIECLDSTK